jgi:hypothetical protein
MRLEIVLFITSKEGKVFLYPTIKHLELTRAVIQAPYIIRGRMACSVAVVSLNIPKHVLSFAT